MHPIQQLREKFGVGEQLEKRLPTEQTPEQKEKERQYFARLKEDRREYVPPKIDLYAQTMDYDIALIKLRKLFAEMLEDERRHRRDFNFRVNYSEAQKAIVYSLLRYFTNNPESPYPLHKGIYLYGECGTGKTRLLRLFEKLTAETIKSFEVVNLTKEIQNAKNHPEFDIIGTLRQGNKCLDEFGFGNDVINDHGNKTHVYDALIYERHLRSQNGKLTHIISNVPIFDAGKFVDFRNVDRFGEMMTPVLFTGETMRK